MGSWIGSIILFCCFQYLLGIFARTIRGIPQAPSHLIPTNFEAESIISPFYR